jgi:phosphotransferase system enzyme I (PtsP)
MALIGLGFRNISMPPATVGPVKAMIRSLHVRVLADYLATLYDLPDRSLRHKLAAFATDHGIAIDGA